MSYRRQLRRALAVLVLLNACLTLSTSATAENANNAIAVAIASPLRPAQDRAQDGTRQAERYLRFVGLRQGDVVAEINAGGGYLARLLPLVVGEAGHVYATNAEFVQQLFDGINERLRASVEAYPNVTVSSQHDDQLDIPARLDAAILNNIYHDLHWQEIDLAVFNQSVFEALRPGGVFVIGDHSAPSGTGASKAGEIHRIERTTVIDEVESAGFVLIDEAEFLHNPDDNRTLHVIDPGIRGVTDRFLLKFQRPE